MLSTFFTGYYFKAIKVYNLGNLEYFEVVNKTVTGDSNGTYRNLFLKGIQNPVSASRSVYEKTDIGDQVPLFIIEDQPDYYVFTGRDKKSLFDFLTEHQFGINRYINLLYIVTIVIVFLVGVLIYYLDTMLYLIDYGTQRLDREKSINVVEKFLFASPLLIGILIAAIFMRLVIKVIYASNSIAPLESGLYLFCAFLFFLVLPIIFGHAIRKYKYGNKKYFMVIKNLIALFGVLNILVSLGQILFSSEDQEITLKLIIDTILDNYRAFL